MKKVVMFEVPALPGAPKKDSKPYQALMGGYRQLLDDANAAEAGSKERKASNFMLLGYEMALSRLGLDVNHVEVNEDVEADQ